MSRRALNFWIAVAIICAGLLFGAVIQNLLLGVFLGALLAAGFIMARSSWRRQESGEMGEDDDGARL